MRFCDCVKEVMCNSQFVHMHDNDVDNHLMEMKTASPKGVFYNICWRSGKWPFRVSLRFITGKKPDAHTITLSRVGFAWGPTTYLSLGLLLKDFEKTSRVWARVGSWSDKR